jgi:hypothetical protein
MTPAEMRRFLKSIGMTAAELRQCQDLATLCEVLGEDRIIPMLVKESLQAGDRATRRTTRRLLAAVGR